MSTKANQPMSFAEMIADKAILNFPQRTAKPTTTRAAEAGQQESQQGSGVAGLPNKVLRRIERAAYIAFELDKKSDKEIAQLLLNTVWGDLHTGTLEAELVDQAITRLRGEHK